MTETERPCGTADPFAVPENLRHLRHAFYLRHPELDERAPDEALRDAAAYDGADPSERVDGSFPGADDPEMRGRARSGEVDGAPGDLAGVVRDFLNGLLTLEDLAEALGEAEGRG